MTGPLGGIRILEFSSIGPAPFAAMVLSNLGGDVLRLYRPGDEPPVQAPGAATDKRGRPAVEVDLKSDDGRALARRLAARADVILEGYRPGVMERLGLGPDDLMTGNPALVYGRMTGYGQDGPLAQAVGHDINYIAVSGVLSLIARRGERPLFPMNLLGDYGGGGMLLALGVVCGVLEARSTGRGQVVDAAMTDGAAQLATVILGMRAAGSWGPPGTNVLDSGAPFYEVYETADSGFVALGAIEPPFYAALLEVLEISATDAPQWDQRRWPELKTLFAATIRLRTRAEWTERAEGTASCLSPVLTPEEAQAHPHHVARQTFPELGGGLIPRVAPRFSGHRSSDDVPPRVAATLASWGLEATEVADLDSAGLLSDPA